MCGAYPCTGSGFVRVRDPQPASGDGRERVFRIVMRSAEIGAHVVEKERGTPGLLCARESVPRFYVRQGTLSGGSVGIPLRWGRDVICY